MTTPITPRRTICKYGPFGPALWSLEERDWVRGEDGKPIPADPRTGKAQPRVYSPRAVRLGQVHVNVDQHGTVLMVDKSTDYPPVVFVKSGKARAMLAMLIRAARAIDHPEVEIIAGSTEDGLNATTDAEGEDSLLTGSTAEDGPFTEGS